MIRPINTSEAINLLSHYPDHPLWDKKISQWTSEDIDSLQVETVIDSVINKISVLEAKIKLPAPETPWQNEVNPEIKVRKIRFTEEELALHQEDLLK